MKRRLIRAVTHRLVWVSMGSLWIAGCVTDLQARDFAASTLVRTFWQTVASVFQASVVANAGS
ncbi:MAG: hypothetical protein IH986_11950 [Planctomycetes bacterium]|nr:hypothetical protein [Planctomycetota bacterium]